MTLEKLLIFGLGLAVFTAFGTIAFNSVEDRKPEYSTYQTKVKDLVTKTDP